MKLYEISDNYKAFLEALENEEIPEEAVADTLEAIEGELTDKVDAIACIIKNTSADADAISAEMERLQERLKAKKKRVEWLKGYLSQSLETIGYPKIETPRNMISFRKSEKVIIGNEDEFIKEHKDLCKEEIKYKINKTDIKKLIKSGELVSGASLESCMNIQIK